MSLHKVEPQATICAGSGREALRTNLLIDGGRKEVTLRDIYKGALGRAETLDITVKLKRLSVVKATHQFPKMGGLYIAGKEQDWRSGNIVVNNADGTSFADVFVYRQDDNAENFGVLCALQAKKVERLSAEVLAQEHAKNKSALHAVLEGSMLDIQDINKVRIITILVTTADADRHFKPSTRHRFRKIAF
ncbi:hypothetical protein BGZ73_005894 [Actinomortierella ambigua]|nr:hypothetical protein BGZ73_005894 [Actinomortierella ambigua]